MSGISKRRVLEILAAAVVVAFVVWLAWPSAVPVDLATIKRGAMEETVDEEARTRVRHVYTVSAPLSGIVLRTEHEVGDPVRANEDIVAVMRPTAPSFHDPRLHQELQAGLAAADAAVALADAERRRAATALNYSRVELARLRPLASQGAIARTTLDKAGADVQANEAALASATAEIEVRRNERTSAAARVRNPADDLTSTSDAACCMRIRSPVTGQILKLVQESEAVVPAGTPLIQIGDPSDLEIVAELLSSDAVQVEAGDPVHVDGWGGPSLDGRVRRLEPAGFLKVSALGIEEQRVRAIIDFTDPPRSRERLGHDYRVIVHVVTWRSPDVLTVPVGALFRMNDRWAVFIDANGRARIQPVVIGHRNGRVAEIQSGLSAGDRVVLHASDRVHEGARIAQRE